MADTVCESGTKGFKSEDDWFDDRLQHDARLLRRIEGARKSLRAGRGIPLKDVEA